MDEYQAKLLRMKTRLNAETLLNRARETIDRLYHFYAITPAAKLDSIKGRVAAINYGIQAVEDPMSSLDTLEAAVRALDLRLDGEDAFLAATGPARSKVGAVSGWDVSGAIDPKRR